MGYQERDYSDRHEPEYDYIFVRIFKVSNKAAYCELVDYDDEKLWIPFSVMEEEGRDLKEGEEEDISVELWFLKKNGIET